MQSFNKIKIKCIEVADCAVRQIVLNKLKSSAQYKQINKNEKVYIITVTECNVINDCYLKEINNKKFYHFIVLLTYSHCDIKKFIVEFKKI